MKRNPVALVFFVMGCLTGWFLNTQHITIDISITRYILYLLLFLIGLNIGSDILSWLMIKSLPRPLFLIPLATIAGTLSFTALAAFFITGRSVSDCLAIGSGFAYYSLSSVLIAELKTASSGLQLATELGLVALMANMLREFMALLGAPLFVRYLGHLAPICAAGATSGGEKIWPVIAKYAGREYIFVAIPHGILIELSVPVLVSFFCSV